MSGPKAVFSTTLERADWGPAEILGDVGTANGELKARDDEVAEERFASGALGQRFVPRA